MSILESKFDTIKNKNINKNKNYNSLAEEAEEELKRVNPEKYYELINSIKETLEEEKQNPGYIKNLFSNQMNGLIDPAFKLPDNSIDENPNKLTLMMDG